MPAIRMIEAGFAAEEAAALSGLVHRYRKAGVRMTVEAGTTDEDDPWLAFLTENGETLLHVAREGDSYVAFGIHGTARCRNLPCLITTLTCQRVPRGGGGIIETVREAAFSLLVGPGHGQR